MYKRRVTIDTIGPLLEGDRGHSLDAGAIVEGIDELSPTKELYVFSKPMLVVSPWPGITYCRHSCRSQSTYKFQSGI
jgi:hypothetical protein